MEKIPLLYLSLGIIIIACGVSLVVLGMSRIIARRVIGEIKNNVRR
ncbi:MAG: hypothetical protein SFU98_17470 [Leptospiraceae bacterium]|nr:hypothetical protein [Leptospiraceae bacterium]